MPENRGLPFPGLMLQVEEFKHLRFIFKSVGKILRSINGQIGAVVKTACWSIVVNILVSERTDPHQRSEAVGGIQKNEIMKQHMIRKRNKFPLLWHLCLSCFIFN